MTLKLRPERDSEACTDDPFLRQLVIDTAAEELGAESWPLLLRGPLLEVQYSSRRNSIRERFPTGRSRIIEVDGEDAGWLFIAEMEDEFRIVEIMIRQVWRGRGIGTAILRGIVEEASRANKPARLHVHSNNWRAIQLYERLGFRRISGDGMNLFLEAPTTHLRRP